MEVIILPSPAEVGKIAAQIIAEAVEENPQAVIGLATGSSPLATYAELAARAHAGTADFSQVRGFALDEYVGIDTRHPQSYFSVIRREVVEPLGMDPALVHVPDGRAADVARAARDYDQAIRAAGGIDVQLLGIGANGHIGFNEPTSSFASRTRMKTLTPRTRADNARFFSRPEEVPTHCVTQGLGTIMEARRLLLVAQGLKKAAAVKAAVEGPVTSMCPASILQFHEYATVIVDEAAADQLERRDYYTYVYENKPQN
jgi:glucosamine-6-phosphate deaminase